ncbi:unnamed protein product [Thelazia callipaeda]|uniref:Homeobox domain-containing protein n=1 Tax=Thelazia callipaeda TaxID=103827 RepID=A0A0N5CJ25_THECL|nr:unnamed protein product [Thelazia callipaeda]
MSEVSTWFANARRRLKKENKMTWSPRNRPGEDDDDDLADIDGSPEQNHSDRPSSSTSDGDITVSIDTSGDAQSKSVTPRPPISEPSDIPTRSLTSAVSSTPKKTKIWSIADTLWNSATERNSNSAGSNKDDREQASTSADDGKSSDDGRESIPTSVGTGSSMVSAGPPSLMPPGAPTMPVINGQIPQHFLQFHSWQQQQLAMAMAARMPFHRPELLTMMAQAGQIRPPMLFNPMFMGSIMPGINQQTSPIPNAVMSSSPSTSQSNGSFVFYFCISLD